MKKLLKLKDFLGTKTLLLFIASILAGIGWFLVEASFIYVFQYFLYSLGLISKAQLTVDLDSIGSSKMIGIIAIIGFGSMRFVASFFKTVLSTLVQHTFVREKRSMIFKMALNNAGKIPTGLLLSIFSETVSQAGTALFYISSSIVSSIATVLFILAGFRLLPKEMAISLGLLLLFLFPYKILNNKIHRFGKILINEWEKVNLSMINVIKNNMFIKIYNMEDSEYRKGESSLIKYEESYKKYTISYALITLFPPFYGIIIVSIISLLFIETSNTNSLNLVSFLYIFMRMAQAASETLGTLSFVKLNLPGLKKIKAWFEAMPVSSSTIEKIDDIRELSLSKVSFSYEHKNSILRDISLDLKLGDILVIKGSSGAGKSTLLSILMGLQKPNSGSIAINGVKKSDFNLSAVIGYTGPIPYLTHDTIRNNVLLGRNLKVSDETLNRILDEVSLTSMVNKMPSKLDEILLEDAQLSTGQKQRICIARALIHNPKILILDEATANLDDVSEKIIIESIKKMSRDIITIIVTHKDSFDRIATQTLFLKPAEEVLE